MEDSNSASIDNLIDHIQHRLQRAKQTIADAIAQGQMLNVEQQRHHHVLSENSSFSIGDMGRPIEHCLVDNRALTTSPRISITTSILGINDPIYDLNTPIHQLTQEDRSYERLVATNGVFCTDDRDQTYFTSALKKGCDSSSNEPVSSEQNEAYNTEDNVHHDFGLQPINQEHPKHPKHSGQCLVEHPSTKTIMADEVHKLLNHFDHSMLPSYQERMHDDDSFESDSDESLVNTSILEKVEYPSSSLTEMHKRRSQEDASKPESLIQTQHCQSGPSKEYKMMLLRLESAIEQSQISMEQLQTWDKHVAGLKRSHSKTMVCSKKSREKIHFMIKRTKQTLSAKAA